MNDRALEVRLAEDQRDDRGDHVCDERLDEGHERGPDDERDRKVDDVPLHQELLEVLEQLDHSEPPRSGRVRTGLHGSARVRGVRLHVTGDAYPPARRWRGRIRLASVGAQPSWAVGRIRISLTSTWGGWRPRHHRAGDVVGLQRVLGGLSKNGVSTIPGSISVTRTPVPLSSWRARLAHRGHRPLGRRVQRAGQRPAAGDRAGQQQVALGLAQRGDRGPDRQRGAVDVGQHHRAPVLGRLASEKPARGAEAGVGEHDVEPAEPLQRAATIACWSSHSVTSQRTASARSGPPSSAAELARARRSSGRPAPAGSRPARRRARSRRRCPSRRP